MKTTILCYIAITAGAGYYLLLQASSTIAQTV